VRLDRDIGQPQLAFFTFIEMGAHNIGISD
jgi:hypothetical protein